MQQRMPTAPVAHEVLVQELEDARNRMVLEDQRFQEVQQAIQDDTVMQSQDAASAGQMEQHVAVSEAHIQRWSAEAQACNEVVSEIIDRRVMEDQRMIQARIDEENMIVTEEGWVVAQQVYKTELTESQLAKDAAESEYLRRKEIHE